MSVLAQSGPVIPNFGGGGDCVRQNRTFCWDWFQDHWGDTFQPALVQHVKLTAIAVGIGFAIAMAASLIAHRRGWFETPFTLVAGILYTIPSLALFQLLVPITGLTVTTAEIALVSYTLLILFRNILTGLRGVPPDVREAARGMGLSSRQILWRVELPLALPAIVAGLRVAVVTVISLATVAAFVVDEGLGAPIFQSIASPFNTAFIAAGGLAVLLALVADALLVGGQRLLTPWAVRKA
jgi:osmoprotectant transport system permease protein